MHCAEARAEHSLHLTVGLLVEAHSRVLERRVERLLASRRRPVDAPQRQQSWRRPTGATR
ncbi:MAG: hypothetical protein HPM95_02250 [Alphaproteobacteria bacterium]|nr:hypothetical protein [Alphaproteobacteria bacterium]